MATDSTDIYEKARQYRSKAAELRARAADIGSYMVRDAVLQAAASFDALSRAAIRQAQWTLQAHDLLAEMEAYEVPIGEAQKDWQARRTNGHHGGSETITETSRRD